MAGPQFEIRIDGLRELNRALSKVNREVAGDVRDALKEAGEPARRTAESYASSRIRNIGPVWGSMRLGARMKSVYIAPATRRRRGSPRPNLGKLLLTEAMIPAAEDKAADTEREVLKAFDRLVRSAGFH